MRAIIVLALLLGGCGGANESPRPSNAPPTSPTSGGARAEAPPPASTCSGAFAEQGDVVGTCTEDCQQGYPEACVAVGLTLSSEGAEERQEAREFFQLACPEGAEEGSLGCLVAVRYDQPAPSAVDEALSALCENGSTLACAASELPRAPDPAWDCTGSLEVSDVTEVIRAEYSRFQACYERALRERGRELSGRVQVTMRVDRAGEVGPVQVEGDLPDEEVLSCVERTAQRLTFPRPQGGCSVLVVPLAFRPTG